VELWEEDKFVSMGFTMFLKHGFLVGKVRLCEKNPVATAICLPGRAFKALVLGLQLVRIWKYGTFRDPLMDQVTHSFEYSGLSVTLREIKRLWSSVWKCTIPHSDIFNSLGGIHGAEKICFLAL
jgi:hypothetical protein